MRSYPGKSAFIRIGWPRRRVPSAPWRFGRLQWDFLLQGESTPATQECPRPEVWFLPVPFRSQLRSNRTAHPDQVIERMLLIPYVSQRSKPRFTAYPRCIRSHGVTIVGSVVTAFGTPAK